MNREICNDNFSSENLGKINFWLFLYAITRSRFDTFEYPGQEIRGIVHKEKEDVVRFINVSFFESKSFMSLTDVHKLECRSSQT